VAHRASGTRPPQNCVTYRCLAPPLRPNVFLVHKDDEEDPIMSIYYNNPALDAELAYRREVLQASGRGTRVRRPGFFRSRRRAR
jgi:hypothetical protein